MRGHKSIKEAADLLPDLETWWTVDSQQFLRAIYWMASKPPHRDAAKRQQAWANLVPQLQAKYPAPSADLQKMQKAQLA